MDVRLFNFSGEDILGKCATELISKYLILLKSQYSNWKCIYYDHLMLNSKLKLSFSLFAKK